MRTSAKVGRNEGGLASERPPEPTAIRAPG